MTRTTDEPDASPTQPPGPRIRLGVSSCLLGEEVRFNGGHKRDTFLLHGLGPYVEWVPVCPEVEVGMGTPRESVRLVQRGDDTAMVGGRSGQDWTEQMRAFSAARAQQLLDERLHGYVFMKDSPSCGVFRVKLYPERQGPVSRDGRGFFAGALMQAHPLLPVEESGRLNDARIRENFIDRIFTYERLRRLLDEDPAPRDLVRFHTVHKFTLLAHSPAHYRKLGPLVASAGTTDLPDLLHRYAAGVMQAMAEMATAGTHTNVLQHLAGHVSDGLDAGDREELTGVITDYRAGLVPLIVPVTLLRHHLRRADARWALEQVYLSPYPKELILRTRI